MNKKLNAEEMAAKRYATDASLKKDMALEVRDMLGTGYVPDYYINIAQGFVTISESQRGSAYAAAIREVAQPLKDQRDQLLSILDDLCKARAEQANEGTPIPPTYWAQARMLINEIKDYEHTS